MINNRIIITLLISYLFNGISAQQNVIYNSKSFQPAEVIETQIGNRGKTFSFKISEIDMSPNGAWAKRLQELNSQGKQPNPEDVPKQLSLLLSVDFKKKFKFPIVEEDSVFVNLSYVKENIFEDTFNKEQINELNASISNSDIEDLKTEKITIEEESQKISKLLQEGKISPEDAMKKIEALTKPMLNKLDNGAIMNQKNKAFKDNRPTHSIFFGNAKNQTESTAYEGTLHVLEFNSKRLIAHFKGVHYTECTDVARANDKSKPCEKEETGLFPGHKVLKVEPVNIIINTDFKTFYDNR